MVRGAAMTQLAVALIASARSSVDAEMYEWGRQDVVAALATAARAHHVVRVIEDPSVEANAAGLAALGGSGAEVRAFPLQRGQIDHVKLLVVDGRWALFGGMNWGGGSYRNRDFDVELGTHAAGWLDSLFAADWAYAGGALRGTDPPTLRGLHLRLLTTFPGLAIKDSLLPLLEGARWSVSMEAFVLTDPAVLEALRADVARGVKVQVLLDGAQAPNHHPADFLERVGARVALYRGEGEKLHAKVVVIDHAVVMVGSANFSKAGLTHNHELDAWIVSPAIAHEMEVAINADWGVN
jgi:cardiolipin synthase